MNMQPHRAITIQNREWRIDAVPVLSSALVSSMPLWSADSRTWTCVEGHVIIFIRFERPISDERASGAALRIGAELERWYAEHPSQPAPVVIFLLLALIAIGGRWTNLQWNDAFMLVKWLDAPPIARDGTTSRLSPLRARVQSALRSADALLDVIRQAGSRWDWARLIVITGQELWDHASDPVVASAIAWHATLTDGMKEDLDHATLLLIIKFTAGFRPRTLPNDIDRSLSWVDVWLDLGALAEAPSPIHPSVARTNRSYLRPANDGLKAIDAPFVRHDVVQSVAEVAESLMHSVDRPFPRLIDAVIQIDIPPGLRELWSRFRIGVIRAHVMVGGMVIALYDMDGVHSATVWWRAHADAWKRCPGSLAPIAWVMLHLTASAIWHDLCAEAITVIPRGPTELRKREAASMPQGRPIPVLRSGSRSLPPRIRLDEPMLAQWGDAAEHARIQSAIARRAHYRRLPGGWETRATKDARQRRSMANERARALGLPDPPPGYTVVRPAAVVGRGANDGAEMPAIPVRCRGLLAASLAMREIAHEERRSDDHPSM